MSLMDHLKRVVRPGEDDDFEEYPVPVKPAASIWNAQPDPLAPEKQGSKVVNIRAAARLQAVSVKPERYENAKEIADHLRAKRTVVLNLESTDREVTRRILDFVSGVAYAQDGKIKKVAVSTYLITPYNIELLDDLVDELEKNGFCI